MVTQSLAGRGARPLQLNRLFPVCHKASLIKVLLNRRTQTALTTWQAVSVPVAHAALVRVTNVTPERTPVLVLLVICCLISNDFTSFS